MVTKHFMKQILFTTLTAVLYSKFCFANVEDPEIQCINDATRMIIEHDQTVNNGVTFTYCLKASSGSNPLVWYFTGHMKLNAIGSQPDINGGLSWLEKAGEAGIAAAQHELAEYYMTGGGISAKVDVPKAIKWLKQLASNKNIKLKEEATFKLCAIYLYGLGIPFNYPEALFWCKKSGLEQHNPDGLTNLAFIHINGLGVDKDVNTAIDYYTNAANMGSVQAQMSLGRAYSIGKDLDENYELAFKWMKKAADQKNPLAIYYLGEMYEYGLGTEHNSEEAIKLYKMSAEMGESQAQYMLGRWYQYSDQQNLDLAAKWYHKAAKQNHEGAMLEIAEMYRYQNAKEMILWYTRTAALGNIKAKEELTKIYLFGTKETSPKYELAKEYASELTEMGNAEGQYMLGYIYNRGLGTEQNPKKAGELLRSSYDSGNVKAAVELAELLDKNARTKDAIKLLEQASEFGCLDGVCRKLSQLNYKIKNWEQTYFWFCVDNGQTEDFALTHEFETVTQNLNNIQKEKIKKEAVQWKVQH